MMEPSMIIRRMEEELRGDYQIEIAEANTYQLHKALSNAVMYAISDNWRRARRAHEHVRRAYYLSAEYLMGRMVFNNLYCLGAGIIPCGPVTAVWQRLQSVRRSTMCMIS